MFDAFARQLDAAAGDPAPAAAWCAEVGLDFDAMIDLARARDALADEMVIAGLNPFRADRRRLAALPVDEFTEGVRVIKRCLYDGLRCRVLRAAPDGAAYISAQGLRVRVPELFSDAMVSRIRALHITPGDMSMPRPQWILTDRIRLVPAQKREEDAGPPLLYTAEACLVSVLDGYVDPDPEFGAARTFTSV